MMLTSPLNRSLPGLDLEVLQEIKILQDMSEEDKIECQERNISATRTSLEVSNHLQTHSMIKVKQIKLDDKQLASALNKQRARTKVMSLSSQIISPKPQR